MRTNEYPSLIVNGDMSGNIVSVVMPVNQGAIASIQANWTGSSVGTLFLQISNDNITYSHYTGSDVDVSSSGNFLWNMLSCGFNFVQLVYTATSGSGTLNATSSFKGN